jgi:hypothetical protein
MAIRTKVTLHCVDGRGNKTRFAYEARDNNPDDGDISDLVAAFKAISNLGVERVSVTRDVTTIAASAAADVDVRVNDVAYLLCHKSETVGGEYTFQMVAVKPAYINPDGTLKVDNAVFTNWCEWFDDGSGLLGVQGPFTISDGESLAENGSTPTLPSGYTPIKGWLDKTRN